MRQQDELIIDVKDRLLHRWAFRLLADLYYFHRWDPSREVLDFHAITRRGLEQLLVRVVRVYLHDVIAGKHERSRVLPEPGFLYGTNPAEELKFWRLLTWLSDIAADLLGSDARASRIKALDLHYGRLRRGPGWRAALEPDLVRNSTTYRQIRRRGVEAEFWESMAFVGKGQPWDHFYFHLVLGAEPDAAYNGGVEPSRGTLERELGL